MKTDMRTAPWPDYKGNEIHEGDEIEHPSGEIGRVIFLMGKESSSHDQWRVLYRDGTISRLSLQIGDKGQAVVWCNR